MPAPGTTPPPKPRTTPQVRPATGINPSTGEELTLPTWASKASYHLRSRVTKTLIATAMTFVGLKWGGSLADEELAQILQSLDTIVLAVGWLLALILNIKRRWTPPVP